METCHVSGPLCPQTSGEAVEPEEEEREPEEELPPSVKLGVGYTKPHYQVQTAFCEVWAKQGILSTLPDLFLSCQCNVNGRK